MTTDDRLPSSMSVGEPAEWKALDQIVTSLLAPLATLEQPMVRPQDPVSDPRLAPRAPALTSDSPFDGARRREALPPAFADGTFPIDLNPFEVRHPSWSREPRAELRPAVDTTNPVPVNHRPPLIRAQSASLRLQGLDAKALRADFPILGERIHGHSLVWLDNAATTQKPRAVIERLTHFYEHENSNVHRAAHTLAARSTDAYEGARGKVARFLGAADAREIVFVRGTTEAVNLVANTWGRKHLGQGDEILLSTLEHHSNLVPWQLLAAETGAQLRFIPVTDRGEVLLADCERMIGARTKLVSITHVSNALGTVLPVREIARAAHRYGACVLIDGAQAVSHFPVDVRSLDADFYVFSGHKLFAPTGVGVLYGKLSLLDDLPVWQGGGNMIEHVTLERSEFRRPPARFEAGTAALAPAVGLGAAIDYLGSIGMSAVAAHEQRLLDYATDCLRRIPAVRLVGAPADQAGVVSFLVDGVSEDEVAHRLDREGIAVRAGHHCAQPTMTRFGLTGTVRASLALYNTAGDIERLDRAVRKIAGR